MAISEEPYGYDAMSEEAVRNAAEEILRSCNTEAQIRVRFVEALRYPHPLDGIFVAEDDDGSWMAIFQGPQGTTITIGL